MSNHPTPDIPAVSHVHIQALNDRQLVRAIEYLSELRDLLYPTSICSALAHATLMKPHGIRNPYLTTHFTREVVAEHPLVVNNGSVYWVSAKGLHALYKHAEDAYGATDINEAAFDMHSLFVSVDGRTLEDETLIDEEPNEFERNKIIAELEEYADRRRSIIKYLLAMLEQERVNRGLEQVA